MCGCFFVHTQDYAVRTMQIPLNDEFEYEGGCLVLATQQGLLTPRRPAGSYTIHTSGTVHGVTRLTRGVRYSLFLCATPRGIPAAPLESCHRVDAPAAAVSSAPSLGPEDLHALATAAEEHLRFYDRALAFLASPPGSDLQAWAELPALVVRYARFMAGQNPAQAWLALEGLPANDVGLELVRRTHLLHPRLYARAVAALQEQEQQHEGSGSGLMTAVSAPAQAVPAEAEVAWLGFNLASAVQRHVHFMRNLTAAPRPSRGEFRAAVAAYSRFLALTRHATVAPPSPLVDHVWHTHMLRPLQYRAACEAVAGELIDHDDEVDDADMARAQELTARLWD